MELLRKARIEKNAAVMEAMGLPTAASSLAALTGAASKQRRRRACAPPRAAAGAPAQSPRRSEIRGTKAERFLKANLIPCLRNVTPECAPPCLPSFLMLVRVRHKPSAANNAALLPALPAPICFRSSIQRVAVKYDPKSQEKMGMNRGPADPKPGARRATRVLSATSCQCIVRSGRSCTARKPCQLCTSVHAPCASLCRRVFYLLQSRQRSTTQPNTWPRWAHIPVCGEHSARPQSCQSTHPPAQSPAFPLRPNPPQPTQMRSETAKRTMLPPCPFFLPSPSPLLL